MTTDVPWELESVSWRLAAERLIAALQATSDADVRHATLKQVAKGLGEEGYPGFIKLLLIVSESDDLPARRVLAETLSQALKRMDLPSGQLTAWGSRPLWSENKLPNAMELALMGGGGHFGLAPKRSFGPLEYLTLWFCQRTQRPYLSEEVFSSTLRSLLCLMNANADIRPLYLSRIRQDLATAPEGAFTRQTKARLRLLADSWDAGNSEAEIAQAVAAHQENTQGWVLRDL